MKFELNKIARASLSGIKPYSTARDEYAGNASVYLDANENPFNSKYNRYPNPSQIELRKAIGIMKDVKPEQVILGNGSDELIDLLFRTFCEPGIDNVVIPQPTYGMYSVSAAINNIEVRQPLLSVDFELDLNAITGCINSHTKLIFLCSPNNPTGNLLSSENIISLLQSFKGIVVIDEAYIEFAAEAGFVSALNQYPNLVVLHTFSKAWGLAGLRLGVGYGSIDIMQLLFKIKPPYNINSVTQEIALDALRDSTSKENWVKTIVQERRKLVDILLTYSFVKNVFPSSANFLLVQMADAAGCYSFLLSKGIIVRDRSSDANCANCLRITIGTQDENEILIQALNEYEKSTIS